MLFKSGTSRKIYSIAAAGVATTVVASGVLFYLAYQDIKQSSLEEMRQIATVNALDQEKTMSMAMGIVNDFETTVSTMQDNGLADRGHVNKLMKSLLIDNPLVLTVWAGWEPDAFDGKDKDYVNAEGYDATGQFVTSWLRGSSAIVHAPLVDYTVPGAGDYYLLPLQQKKPVVIEPYVYPVDGKNVLMTSVAKPINVDGKIVGVGGIDISLDAANKAISAVRPMGTGSLSLITSAGAIISHPDPALIGKNIKDGGTATVDWAKLISAPGTTIESTDADDVETFSVAYPVKVTADLNWYAIVAVPKATVFAKLDNMVWSAAAIIGLAALLLGCCGWLIARGLIKRISTAVSDTREIAGGNLDITLNHTELKDEIGDLSRSLVVLLESNRQKLRLEQEAVTAHAAREAERVERTRLNTVHEEEVKFAVAELASGLSKLSQGDMTARLERPFTDSLDEIRKNFNQSVEKLQAAMVSFSENAAAIQAGSDEIKSAADDLARRTEQQAASVEETAAALEQITTSVKDSTSRAEEAGALVSCTKEDAERSGEVVRQAVSAMSSIERSSRSISNIIGVIDDIAFQTNLLALNAGVEAARAGDAGKGFAVVAQEVRELAQRSAGAAKEIKALITSSGEEVKRGVNLVGKTGEALQAIVAEVQQINSNVQAIVQAAREQSTGLQEINTAVNQMDQATQQNAAMVEESNAASHALATEVSSLSARLDQFDLGGGTQPTQCRVDPVHRPTARSAPVAVVGTRDTRYIPSPARALTSRLASAYGGGTAAAAASANWEEF
ncbi:methyl-accepting chemotaxis protein [Rhizobium brockwellii]|uniref:methyl-accepting chemotaxis protein n=1 Tax=Rhizobium TaxID=379 RepID=UPI003F9941A5